MECLRTILEMIYNTTLAMKGYFLLVIVIIVLSYFI